MRKIFVLAAPLLLLGISPASAQYGDSTYSSGDQRESSYNGHGGDGGDACCQECNGGGKKHKGHRRNRRNAEDSTNCNCNGSYKFPVPPLYTYHWPGMYSQRLMTDYQSPWRFPALKPYVEEVPREELSRSPRIRQASSFQPYDRYFR